MSNRVETAQDLVEALEGMMDGDVVVVLVGSEKQFEITEVSRRAYRFPTPKVVIKCREREKVE